MRKLFTTVVLALFVGLFAASASASTEGSTLENVPARTVCQFNKFTVGVWAQAGTSLANRRYIVNVWSPRDIRVLHKEGHAPESPAGWALWHVIAGRTGTYYTYYHIWYNGVEHTNRWPTTSSHC
jgi:hypothetical protein